jgi:hypothetical protein
MVAGKAAALGGLGGAASYTAQKALSKLFEKKR